MDQQVTRRLIRMLICGWLAAASGAVVLQAEAPREALAAFDKYSLKVEERLTHQHGSAGTFLTAFDQTRVRSGQVIIEKISADADPSGGMLHDWRGTAFAPGAKPADFERVLRDLPAYPKVYAPQVLTATVEPHDADHYGATMRVRQKHVLTVVMDISYDVTFGRLDPRHGYNIARSTKIAEIDAPGTRKEHALSPAEEHGFMWRLNTYWSYEERDGGLYLQVESISLSRSIPTGLGWAIGPFVESVPRESLEFTLRKTCDALKR
ncbi:MAG TPA: hypothetical protein VGJ21_03615 [Terracidiphilus sp.]